MSITLDGLNAALHSVKISDGTNNLLIDSSGYLTAKIDGTVTVDATDLDIRNLSASIDNLAISDGTNTLAVEADGSINVNAIVELDAFDTWKHTNQSITSTASQLAATSLTGRKRMIIQNLGAQDIYIGTSNAVTVAVGILVPKGASLDENFSATAAIWALTASGTSDVRIAEFAD